MIFRVRSVPSCPGYFVSDTGRVWGPRTELKPYWRGDYFRFTGAPGRRCIKVHHAVAEAFLGPKPPGAWVCHRNDDATDNRVENLYYGDAHTNNLDSFRNGRRSHRGERNTNAKLTWKQVRAIRGAVASGAATQVALARKHGLCDDRIANIIHNRRWKELPPASVET